MKNTVRMKTARIAHARRRKRSEAQLKKVMGEVRTKLSAGDIEGALAFF